MPIHLITGVPGAGKSLRAVQQCVQRIGTDDEQDRPVFGNVRGFKRQAPLPGSNYQNHSGEFVELEGTWMDCPDGSIIVIDEVQERWRRYRNTGEPPPEIAALERHRHRNIDFIITCQNPKQLSDDVRSLVDVHEHLTKKTKGVSTVYCWRGRASTTPYSGRRDADCEVSVWRFPKWVFAEYVSADVHVVRTKVPRIWYAAACALVAVPLSLWYAYGNITSLVQADDSPPVASAPASSPAAAAVAVSAPRPVVAPEPAMATAYGGALMGERCRLLGQDGRPLLTSRPECLRALDSVMPIDVEILEF